MICEQNFQVMLVLAQISKSKKKKINEPLNVRNTTLRLSVGVEGNQAFILNLSGVFEYGV